MIRVFCYLYLPATFVRAPNSLSQMNYSYYWFCYLHLAKIIALPISYDKLYNGTNRVNVMSYVPFNNHSGIFELVATDTTLECTCIDRF